MSTGTRRRCAFLTLEHSGDYTIDDDLAVAPLKARGIDVETVPWDAAGIDWSAYDLVVVRSPWDYPERPEEFLAILAEIEASKARLENDLELMRWNLDKTYLRRLEESGVPTIPTLWRDRLEAGDLERLFELLAGESMIVKPLVGGGSMGAWHVTRANLASLSGEVESYYRDRALLAQAFVTSVIAEGEYSLIYFDGEFSHALVKRPKAGEFRSQEEFGSDLNPVNPSEGMLRAGTEALEALPLTPLYARVDFLRAPDSETFWLIELELVEPSLYLRMDDGAPQRFSRAISGRMP